MTRANGNMTASYATPTAAVRRDSPGQSDTHGTTAASNRNRASRGPSAALEQEARSIVNLRVTQASDPTDLSLLQRIAARDTAALAELYDRHCRLIFGLIVRIVGDRGEAEDLLQETFVRVWNRAEIYDVRIGGPLPWIVRVARNIAIDRIRARRVRAAVDTTAVEVDAAEPATPDATIQSPEAAVLEAERHGRLADALSALPVDQRRLIEAAFFEGYTHTELAERFALPLGTVKTRIRAGMLAMRHGLANTV
jgi:RNA polymerase sigma-70 factor, ECF subfamily